MCREILSGVPWEIIQFGFFQIKDVQIPLFPLRNGHLYMKDAHSAESNEELNFRFFRDMAVFVLKIGQFSMN